MDVREPTKISQPTVDLTLDIRLSLGPEPSYFFPKLETSLLYSYSKTVAVYKQN